MLHLFRVEYVLLYLCINTNKYPLKDVNFCFVQYTSNYNIGEFKLLCFIVTEMYLGDKEKRQLRQVTNPHLPWPRYMKNDDYTTKPQGMITKTDSGVVSVQHVPRSGMERFRNSPELFLFLSFQNIFLLVWNKVIWILQYYNWPINILNWESTNLTVNRYLD